MELITYNDMPIISVSRSAGVRWDAWHLTVCQLWRPRLFKLRESMLTNGKISQLHRFIGKRVDITRPLFLAPREVTFSVFSMNDHKMEIVSIPIVMRGIYHDALSWRLRPGDIGIDYTKRVYYWQKACRTPEVHGVNCKCKPLDDFELPVEVRIEDWVEKLS